MNYLGTLKKNLFQGSSKKLSATKSEEPSLYDGVVVGKIGKCSNRIALAPMTRVRATPDGVVGKLQVEYYTQRATAGLLITEGVNVSPQAVGSWCAPNFWTDEQINAWRPVIDAVHAQKSLIVMQLWHTGRVSHSLFHGGKLPVAPSAIGLSGTVHVPNSKESMPAEVPRALETAEVPGLIAEFVTAAKIALSIGFDGVELHGANGYIIDEFIQSTTNKRTDKYGGSIENRMNFLSELFAALEQAVPMQKVGIRYSPNTNYQDTGSPDNLETFSKAIELAAKYNLAYVHVLDGLAFGFHNLCPAFTIDQAMKIVSAVQGEGKKRVTKVIANCGYTKASAEEAVKRRATDLVSFGRPFIANPDLVRRFKENIPLTEVEGMGHWFTPNLEHPEIGYVDFEAAKV